MTKSELIAKVAKESGLKKIQVEQCIDTAIKILAEALARGERTVIPGFGVFNVRERKARKGRNPRTGKEIIIPARKVVVFTATKSLREKLAEKESVAEAKKETKKEAKKTKK
jgi:DNA-binding protein HU-beta